MVGRGEVWWERAPISRRTSRCGQHVARSSAPGRRDRAARPSLARHPDPQAAARRPDSDGRSRSARTTASSALVSASRWPSVTASMTARLRCSTLGHLLVDRLRGEQVVRRHGVVLADAVAAILGLVVARRRPVELEERDVGRAHERDALRRGLQRADDERRAVGALEVVDGGGARGEIVRRRARAPRPGSARPARAGPRGDARRRPAARPTRRSPRSRRSLRAACRARRGGAGSSAARAARRAAPRRPSPRASRRSSGCVRSQAMTSASASRYSAALSSSTGHAREALGRQLRQDVGLRAAHVAVRAKVPVQPVQRLGAAKAPPEAGAAAEVRRGGRRAAAARRCPSGG